MTTLTIPEIAVLATEAALKSAAWEDRVRHCGC